MASGRLEREEGDVSWAGPSSSASASAQLCPLGSQFSPKWQQKHEDALEPISL